MKAIANSNPAIAIRIARGRSPRTKSRIPETIILKINPAKIFISICPAITLAPNRIPRERPHER
ncbi:orf 144, partial (mitochondrion) [Pneumocystis jirovecii]